MNERFTAWLVRDPSSLSGEFIELSVTQDADLRDGTQGKRMLHVLTKVEAVNGDMGEAVGQAEAILRTRYWKLTTQWEYCGIGLLAAVEPA